MSLETTPAAGIRSRQTEAVTTDAGLLSEIEADVLGARPLADALRKCVVLGGKAGSVELREWATKELRGYDPDEDVPTYRTVGSHIFVNAVTGSTIITGQMISPMSLPEFARDKIKETYTFLSGVGEIEAYIVQAQGAKGGMLDLSVPAAADLGRLMDAASGNPFQHINAIYWSISAASLQTIVDQVRTTLAELVAEMRAGMPRGADVPSAAVATQAVNVAVRGSRARVSVTTAQAGEGSTAKVVPQEEPTRGFWTRGRRVGAFVVGLAGVVVAVVAVIQLVH